MKRFTVLGFTEAELGFVLAALFAALAAAYTSPQTGDARVQRDSLAAELRQTVAERDSIARALANVRDSVARLPKISTKIPQCWEFGEARDTIARFRVLGANLYELNGERMSFAAVQSRFKPYTDRHSPDKCRFIVVARAMPGVGNIGDHINAVQQLRRLFDVYQRTY